MKFNLFITGTLGTIWEVVYGLSIICIGFLISILVCH